MSSGLTSIIFAGVTLLGGPDGIYITEFLKHFQKPVVTTCHTVLQNPSSVGGVSSQESTISAVG